MQSYAKNHPRRIMVTRIKRFFRMKFGHLRVTYVMAFSRVLADDVVEVICDEDFGLSDGDESEFEGGDDNHALLGETVLRREDFIGDYLDKENTSEEQDNDAIEMPEASAEIEDEHEESSRVSLLGDTCTADPCLRRSRLRVSGGERQRREMEERKPKTYTNCSI